MSLSYDWNHSCLCKRYFNLPNTSVISLWKLGVSFAYLSSSHLWHVALCVNIVQSLELKRFYRISSVWSFTFIVLNLVMDSFNNSTCGSRISSDLVWTWHDGRVYAIGKLNNKYILELFLSKWKIFYYWKSFHVILALAFVGGIGTSFNGLVLIGVGGNVKLGTTINKFLIWICSMALLESTIGIGIRTLILGMYNSINP